MPHFSYVAMDGAGRTIKATMEAENEALVLAKLRERNLQIVEIKEGGGRSLSMGQKKVKPKSLVVFSRQFATMIDAGIPVLRCLEILSTQTKDPAMIGALQAITNDVKGGMALNESMVKHPKVFSKLYVNMVRAAELGGILDIILDRLAGFLEYEADVRAKIKGAMMYPVLVIFFSMIMLMVLFSFVLPKFKEIFDGMDVELPALTAGLFAIGTFMQSYWWTIVLFNVGLFVAYKMWAKTPKGGYQLDFFKLKIPMVGELILKMSVARFCRTFGTLINSGVPIMRSLEIVGETLDNKVLAGAIEQTRASVREGNKLSVPLAESGFFPTMVTHMIDVGEESGRLSDMLVKVGDFYDAEVEATVKGLTSMIEPLLIIFLGVVVGFIAISVMTPIFSIVNSVSN
jgi:type IV pilus assembly protein PilC